MPRHKIIKLTKIKDKENILKTMREKQQITYKGIPIKLSADFSEETLQARREWNDVFKVMKGKNLQPRIPCKALIQISWRDQTLYRQAKVQRVQHHQTSFITNAKGTAQGRKEKPTTRNRKLQNGKAHW